MEDFNEVILSYGQSDEYSFVFRYVFFKQSRFGLDFLYLLLFTRVYRVAYNLISLPTLPFPIPYSFILPFLFSFHYLPFLPSSLPLPFFPLPFPFPSSLLPLPFPSSPLDFLPTAWFYSPPRGGGGNFIHPCLFIRNTLFSITNINNRKDSGIYSRRGSKLITNIASLFAASYVFHWPQE